MIPSVCPADAPPGERELFRRLRDDPETKGWTVLHSLDLAKHVDQVSGEADFVVIVPSAGILVIEVKSHRTIHVDEHGWHLGRDTQPDPKGPFKQASSAMHSLRAYLADCDPSFSSLVTWSAVCFPRVDFRLKSPEWHAWQVIDRVRICSAPISRLILGILSNGAAILAERGVACARNQATHASTQRCEAASKALRPRFEVAVSPKAARREMDRSLLQLTEEQFTALDQSSLNPRVIFSGPAGTGKTVLAMESLRRSLVENPGLRIGLFCYNRLLGEELSLRCRNLNVGATVGHIDAWLDSLARARITDKDRKAGYFFEERLPSAAIDALLDDSVAATRFDILIIDEAQDLLQDRYLDIFDLVLEGGLAGGRWLMFGDFVGQDIFARGRVGVEEFIRSRCPSAARFLLTTNCRNTLPISEYVSTLGDLKPPYAKVLREDDHHDPCLRFWNNRDEQMALISRFLDDCLAEGFEPRDIVILSPLVEGSIGKELALDPVWSTRVSPWGKTKDRASYTTIQKFKGMEAPVVVVADIEMMDSDQQKSLFYIGLSRALHRLGVFLHADLRKYIQDIL